MRLSLINAVSTASLLCYLPHTAAQRYGGGKSKTLSEKLQASITTRGQVLTAASSSERWLTFAVGS